MEVRLLNTFPHYERLGPTEIVAMGGFGTVSTEDFLEMYEGTSSEEITKKVRDILLKAIIRGYASMTTSAYGLFAIRGSRILDFYLTAYPFGSYMVLSQRYVPIEKPEVPDWVGNDVKRLVKEEIKVYNELIEMGIRREEARGVLGLGAPSHMLAVLPLESISNLFRWEGDHPEIKEFLGAIKREVEKSDLRDMLRASLYAPTMGGPFPHPFHRRSFPTNEELKVSSFQWNGESEGAEAYRKAIEKIRNNPPTNWLEMVKNTILLSKIAYEHINEVWVMFEGKIPLTTFNELKRHRTVPIEVEGIYRAMERADFYIYPSVKNNTRALDLYNWVLEGYRKLNAPEYEAVYALPQSLKIGVRFSLNFAQLTAPSLFYRMRSCDRAEVSMKQLVRKIPYLLRRAVPHYGELLFNILTSEIGGSRIPLPKCVVGACPEPEYCPLIRGVRPDYSMELHDSIKRSRKEVFR